MPDFVDVRTLTREQVRAAITYHCAGRDDQAWITEYAWYVIHPDGLRVERDADGRLRAYHTRMPEAL